MIRDLSSKEREDSNGAPRKRRRGGNRRRRGPRSDGNAPSGE